MTAYEMCFGKTPFRGENDEELEAAIQAVNYKFPVKGPRGKFYLEFKDLVARLIKKRASGETRMHTSVLLFARSRIQFSFHRNRFARRSHLSRSAFDGAIEMFPLPNDIGI